MRSRQAFTIFELTITLVVISVFAAVCITHYFGRGDITLEKASVLLAKDLRAAQNRDIISILPDGRRVYEFHPWEKKLALVNTYVYTDVSIYNYLKRLRKDGEQIKEYNTIWYYY